MRFRRYALAAAVLLMMPTPAGPAAAQDQGDLPPAGYGTLRQEDVSVKFETSTLQVRVLPLDERIIRLLAPDTYQGLRGLKALKQSAIDSIAERFVLTDPSLFVVTFFAREPRSEFNADDVAITSRNRFFRPIAILPLTPRWSEQRLDQRQTAIAVYLFEPGISPLEPMTVSYGGVTSRAWDETVVRRLDEERAAVLARVRSDR